MDQPAGPPQGSPPREGGRDCLKSAALPIQAADAEALRADLRAARATASFAVQARNVAQARVAELESYIEAIHRSTVWRRTRWAVRQVERARRIRQRPLIETLGLVRRRLLPDESRRGQAYAAALRPLVVSLFRNRSMPLPAHAAAYPLSSGPTLQSPGIDLGPLKFIPHEGGFFSNFNFLIGEMYLGRAVYPLFSFEEATRHTANLKQLSFIDRNCENAWFEFFEPIAYEDGDTLHTDTRSVAALPETWGQLAAPEFRDPRTTLALYHRPDFADWRSAVHRAVAGKIKVADDIRQNIEQMLAQMPGRRIGVHVRHPSHLVEQGDIYFRDYFTLIDRIRETDPRISLFLATDNDLAIAVFRLRYGDAVHCYPDFIRTSVDEVMDWVYALMRASSDNDGFVGGVGFQSHYILAAAGGGADGLRAGKQAVTDVFTLAACDDFVS